MPGSIQGAAKPLCSPIFQLAAENPRNLAHQTPVFTADKRDRVPGCTGTAGAADAVGLGNGGCRNVIIDYMRDPADIDAAGGDVRCHKDFEAAVAKALYRLLSVVLGQVAMKGGRIVPR